MVNSDKFLVVIDACVLADYINSDMKYCSCAKQEECRKYAKELIENMNKEVNICLDIDEANSMILKEYKDRVGKKNADLLKKFIIFKMQGIYFMPDKEILKLSTEEKKELVLKGFDRKDFIYVSVAQSITNERYIVSNDHTFYNPKNKKSAGEYTAIIASLLKKEYKIHVRIAKDSICQPICNR